jgi:Family of unknown function (DUF6868)
MSVEMVGRVLLWCTIINFGLLLVWFLAFTFAHQWLQQIWGRWFRLSAETFDAVNFGLIAAYKLAILFFNLIPLIALHIVG